MSGKHPKLVKLEKKVVETPTGERYLATRATFADGGYLIVPGQGRAAHRLAEKMVRQRQPAASRVDVINARMLAESHG